MNAQFPILQPPTTRAISSNTQREQGVGGGVQRSFERRQGTYGRRSTEISLSGIRRFADAFRPQFQEVASQTEVAERDRAVNQSVEARALSATEAMEATTQALRLKSETTTEAQSDIYVKVAEKLMSEIV